ncbi:ATP-binding protein [Spirosoma montaniterrae]|uniref:histidine kinase n=1 Tax=Spirosoma montaniterrae TaxID=1178516 RepID=A0A1P9WZY1_9BACT|nr:ATP-binding protein [Spirosoma montaniterrae]AQG80895.1 histidine kinase [Spirosoma montaniterrae]
MSIPDGIGAIVTAALMLQYLRKFLDIPTRLPDWDWVYKNAWPAAGVLIGIFVLFKGGETATFWVWAGVYGIVCYTIWRIKNYQPARTILLALAPLAVVTVLGKLFKAIAPSIYNDYDVYVGSAAGFAILWLFSFFFIANRQKKSAVKVEEQRRLELEELQKIEAKKQELEYLVSQRTAEITSQKEALEQALADLKATQNQLIHSEKMASLGELTAGIAHEIQNPLNFVNNFAEVSVELITELEEEREKGDAGDKELEADLLADLRQNLHKITQHGGRASSIVKGMLQHSRAGTGQREPTDLNALCDEYLRLAYHGLRAKDKSFNAQFSVDTDPSLGLVTVVPQDIGRVLLNLFTNAFYAVRERQKSQPASSSYQPRVSVSTRCQDGQAVIWVADNGTGIPESAIQKIFQPFFTTKPTGEGTGLGLSLAYDIVTKGHNGTLMVSSEENKGTTFTISLPA